MTDRQLLETILFNAGQNALDHGEEGAQVHIDAEISSDNQLGVTIQNLPGKNHAVLQARGPSHGTGEPEDLFVSRAASELASIGAGSDRSTFQGLLEMKRAAEAFEPPATVSLRAYEARVIFRFRCVIAPVPLEQQAIAEEGADEASRITVV